LILGQKLRRLGWQILFQAPRAFPYYKVSAIRRVYQIARMNAAGEFPLNTLEQAPRAVAFDSNRDSRVFALEASCYLLAAEATGAGGV
jgi:hypothetical protein